MRAMFRLNPSFNDDISNWNVANLTDLQGTFNQATSFNGNISIGM